MQDSDWITDTRTSYDTVAASYADMYRDTLGDEPVVRHLLALFAELVQDAGGGAVLDVGCGTGRVTRYLHDLGVSAAGVDLSPGMVAMARRDHPDLRFDVGSMTDLEHADGSVTGGHPMKVHVYQRPLERVVGWLDGAGFRMEVRTRHNPDETVTGGLLIARPRRRTDSNGKR